MVSIHSFNHALKIGYSLCFCADLDNHVHEFDQVSVTAFVGHLMLTRMDVQVSHKFDRPFDVGSLVSCCTQHNYGIT